MLCYSVFLSPPSMKEGKLVGFFFASIRTISYNSALKGVYWILEALPELER